jgi:hypothetical protein
VMGGATSSQLTDALSSTIALGDAKRSGRCWAGASRAAVATRGFSAPSASSWATRGVT